MARAVSHRGTEDFAEFMRRMMPLVDVLMTLRRDRAPDARDLLQVHQIVTSIQSAQVLDAFLPALGVDADAVQVLRRRALEEPEVPSAKDAKRFQRLGWVGLSVVKVVGPLILVVAGDRRAILRED